MNGALTCESTPASVDCKSIAASMDSTGLTGSMSRLKQGAIPGATPGAT